MNLTEREIKIQKEAVDYIESHEKELIDMFILSKKPIQLDLFTFFMAGSPGAGKTEFSRRYMDETIDKTNSNVTNRLREMGVDIDNVETFFVRIDADEIRDFLPQYRKTDVQSCVTGNSHVMQKAANKGLDILRRYCFQNSISFLHDGTFGNYETMKDLIKKSLRRNRNVQIFYIYLDPLVAWEFTKAREFLEGRNIIKEKFIEQFFSSRENVDKVKREFGNKVTINCIVKNQRNEPEEIRQVDNVDNFVKEYYNRKSMVGYTGESLRKLIPDV